MSTFTHGASGYRNHGCHCEVCTEGHRERCATQQARRVGSLQPGDSRHGTVNGYGRYDCRCVPCTQAKADENRRYRTWRKSREGNHDA